MRITKVKVTPISDGSKVRAYASITLDDAIAIKDVKIIQSNGKTFVSMPAKKRRDGTHHDLVFPINQDTRNLISSAIFAEYKRQTGEALAC